MSQILIVEDEPRIAAFIAKGLRAAGFATLVEPSGEVAVGLAVSGEADLIVLDVGLPDIDGFEVLARLRGQGVTTPVIMLTARSSVADTVAGLQSGADDYMPKPFSFEELLARIHLRLRAEPGPESATVLSHGDLSLDLRTRRAVAGSRTVDLTAREFTLAEVFLRQPRTGAQPRAAAVGGLGVRLRPRLERGGRLRPLPAPQAGRGVLRDRPGDGVPARLSRGRPGVSGRSGPRVPMGPTPARAG
jgi:DNA-binding response OmpR family regulator